MSGRLNALNARRWSFCCACVCVPARVPFLLSTYLIHSLSDHVSCRWTKEGRRAMVCLVDGRIDDCTIPSPRPQCVPDSLTDEPLSPHSCHIHMHTHAHTHTCVHHSGCLCTSIYPAVRQAGRQVTSQAESPSLHILSPSQSVGPSAD